MHWIFERNRIKEMLHLITKKIIIINYILLFHKNNVVSIIIKV